MSATKSRWPTLGLTWAALLLLLLLLVGHDRVKQADGQLEAVGAVLSVVPVTSILATAGVVGVKLAALSRLLQALGYDQAYLANGGSGTAAEPIGLQTKYAYMFPYVPGLNISVKGDVAPYQNTAGQAREGPVEDKSHRKTYPAMSLPGDYENQNRPYRGVDTLRDVFSSVGLKMLVPANQQQFQQSKGNQQQQQNLASGPSSEPDPASQSSGQQQQQQQQQNSRQPSNSFDSVSPPPPSQTASLLPTVPSPNNAQPLSANVAIDQSPQQSFSSSPTRDQSGPQSQSVGQQKQQQLPVHPMPAQSAHKQPKQQQQAPSSQVNMPHPRHNLPHLASLRNPTTASSSSLLDNSLASRFQFHPIPQHEFYYRKYLQEKQAREHRSTANFRPPLEPSPATSATSANSANSAAAATLATGMATSSLDPIIVSTNLPFTSNDDDPPPFVDDLDESNLVLRAKRHATGEPSDAKVSLGSKILAAAAARSNMDHNPRAPSRFGMPAVNPFDSPMR